MERDAGAVGGLRQAAVGARRATVTSFDRAVARVPSARARRCVGRSAFLRGRDLKRLLRLLLDAKARPTL
jgi:hypothetical protein